MTISKAKGRIAFGVASGLGFCSLVSALPGDPIDAELRVNVETLLAQQQPDVAADAQGNFLVVWQGWGAQGQGIYARRYEASGSPLGGDVLVSADTSATGPVVAMDAAGSAFVVWSSAAVDGSGQGIAAQRLDGSGAPVGVVIAVNTEAAGDQGTPDVAMDGAGNAVVAWASEGQDGSGWGVVARRVGSDGFPLGAEVPVNDTVEGDQMEPAVAVEGDGAFVVIWSAPGVPGSRDIYAKRFDGADLPRGAEFRVNTTDGDLGGPAVAVEPQGHYTIVWHSDGGVGPNADIYGQSFNMVGATGSEFRVNTSIAGAQRASAIAMDSTLRYDNQPKFVVTWQSEGEGILAQRFNRFSEPVGYETLVNTDISGAKSHPAVAMDGNGDIVAVWESEGQDGSAAGVYGQRFSGPDAADLALTLQASADPAEPGTPLVYYAQVENRYPSDGQSAAAPAEDVVLEFTLPDGASLVDAYGDGWTCTGSTSLRCELDSPLQPYVSTQVQLQVTTPSTPGEITLHGSVDSSTVDSDLFSNLASLTTRVGDVPDAFSFTDVSSVTRGSTQTSNAITVQGVDQAVAISVSGGEYSIDGGAYTSSAGTVLPGQGVRVRHVASSAFSTSVNTRLTIEGVSDTFTSMTETRDVNPDPFAFADQTNVAPGSTQTSNAVTISGINDAAPISVSGGSYSINGGAFTTAAGTVVSGDQLRLRHAAATGFSTNVSTTLYVGNASDTFISTTEARDTTPAAFAFVDQTGVAPLSQRTSNVVTITGINDATPVSVNGGSYRINNGSYTSSPGTARSGDELDVLHHASASYSTSVTTTLTVGGVSDSFTSTTRAADTTPGGFFFTDQSGVLVGSLRTSSAVGVTGIDDATPISVNGGSYSINSGAFMTAPGTVVAGDSVRVQHVAASGFATSTDTVLTIGGVADTFTSTTEARDTTPAAFSFTDQTGVATGSLRTSNSVTVAGINDATAISVSGGSYSINGGAFTTTAGTVVAGDQVRVQHTASPAASTAVNTVLTISGVSDTFSSTTGTADTTPNAYGFTDVSGARRGSTVTSAAMTIGGINAATPISVSGANAQYSRNGGAFTSAAGTVNNGESIRLRVTASSSATTPVNVSVTIGGVSDTWTVTTGTK